LNQRNLEPPGWRKSSGPDVHDGSVLVEAVAVGVCGTDVEIVDGKYGWAPQGKRRLVLGHDLLGRVLDPGPTGRFRKGDLVAGIVRRPDPVPCPNCALGEWDMCRNGRYTERGIKEIDGFMSDLWRIEPDYAIKVDNSLRLVSVLLEPTTVETNALLRFRDAPFNPRSAGPMSSSPCHHSSSTPTCFVIAPCPS
jgi:glucose 1-dehydrogenase